MARQEPDLKEFERQFTESLEAQRAEELGALAELGEAQALFQVFLEHESRRLDGELGEDHPRARSLKAAAADNLTRIGVVNDAVEIGRIRVPAVAESDALVHGRVREAGGRGIRGLTVCLVDRANEPLAGIDPSTTDESGYFSIVVPLANVGSQRRAGRQQVYLAVFSPDGKQLHREKRPLQLAQGARLQISVTLREEVDVGDTGPVPTTVQKKHRRTRDDATAGRGDDQPDAISDIVATLAKDRRFAEIGASVRKLENRLRALGVETAQAARGLLGAADRKVRDGLRLPNLKSARAFKRILARVLKDND